MRASDIVTQLAAILPTQVEDFSDTVAVSSLASSGTTVTVTTSAAHGLTVGRQVNITGAQTPIPCSITRSGILGTLVTTSDHDITEGAGFDVQISGAAEAAFNGTFVLHSVPNRRTIKFIMADSGATTATGSPLLLNGSNVFQSYNGIREVLMVPTATTFTYSVAASLYSPAYGTIQVRANPRISSAIDFDRIVAAYTQQPTDKAWLFVVMGDGVAYRNRNLEIDATDNIQRGNYYNQRIAQTVTLFVFVPTSAQLSGRAARDRCEELLAPICRSIVMAKFPSLVENSNNPLMLVNHGYQLYNGAYYVHQYTFEATLQLGPTDIYQPSDDVAFRDIDLDMYIDNGPDAINTLIDLDDEPL
jgi:hypothetical protein